jgi:hypothetical protein
LFLLLSSPLPLPLVLVLGVAVVVVVVAGAAVVVVEPVVCVVDVLMTHIWLDVDIFVDVVMVIVPNLSRTPLMHALKHTTG